jgi:hypothetical protein
LVRITFRKLPEAYSGMKHTTFKEWLARCDEGFLLPDRPPLKGMFKINTTPGTDAQRKRLHPKKVKPPKLFKPTVRRSCRSPSSRS